MSRSGMIEIESGSSLHETAIRPNHGSDRASLYFGWTETSGEATCFFRVSEKVLWDVKLPADWLSSTNQIADSPRALLNPLPETRNSPASAALPKMRRRMKVLRSDFPRPAGPAMIQTCPWVGTESTYPR